MYFPWAAGWIPHNAGTSLGWQPREGSPIPAAGTAWTVDHTDGEVRSVTDREVSVTVLGTCLARDEELRDAPEAARRERWEQLASWPGSYVTVVRRPQETVMFGDLAGAARVYVTATEKGHLWGTAATPLGAFIGAKHRLELLALRLAVLGGDSDGGAVPLHGVDGVPPGSVLRIGRDRPTVERWYEPSRFAPAELSFPEAARLFRELLVDAVARRAARAGSLISGDLSGGIDSSALMCLATREIDGVGLTYADHPNAAATAARIVEEWPRLRHEVIHRDERTLHYGGLDQLPVTDLPSGDLAVLGPDRAIIERAASFRVSHHVIGVGGDELMTARPTGLVTLLRAGRRREAIRGALALSRAERIPAARMLLALRRLAATSYPQALREIAGQVRSGAVNPIVEPEGWQHFAWGIPMAAAGWLSPRSARWGTEWLLALAENDPGFDTPEALEDWQEIRHGATDIQGYRALARQLGITVHTPYYDNQLLARFLAMPGHARELAGRFKALAAIGLADLLPATLRNTTRKDDNNVLLADQEGLQHNARALRALVASSALISEGILEHAAVSAYVERAIDDVDTRHRSLIGFIAAELWLRDSDLHRQTWWEETDVRSTIGSNRNR